jgi:hypothetical protein
MFKLGCDPELFLQDAAAQLVSSIGKIGGSKENPSPLPLGKGYAVQEDNVAVEFNIPPADNMAQFDQSIQKTIAFLEEGIKNKYNLCFSGRASASFPASELLNPKALEFGCDPDFNAWTMEENPKPKADDKNLRSCGGHVHVGFKGSTVEKARLGRLMDLFLAVPATVMDEDDKRKQLYGKMGAVRFKTYGLEYRVLSNFWIFDKQRREWVWKSTEKAMDALQNGFAVEEYENEIRDAVNNGNKAIAKSLINQFNLLVA